MRALKGRWSYFATTAFEGELDTYAQDVKAKAAETTAARVREHAVHDTFHQTTNIHEDGGPFGGAQAIPLEPHLLPLKRMPLSCLQPALFSELERDLISLRTKEALACKKREGQILRKPKGTLQKSKIDKDIEKIKELLSYDFSMRKTVKYLDIPIILI